MKRNVMEALNGTMRRPFPFYGLYITFVAEEIHLKLL